MIELPVAKIIALFQESVALATKIERREAELERRREQIASQPDDVRALFAFDCTRSHSEIMGWRKQIEENERKVEAILAAGMTPTAQATIQALGAIGHVDAAANARSVAARVLSVVRAHHPKPVSMPELAAALRDDRPGSIRVAVHRLRQSGRLAASAKGEYMLGFVEPPKTSATRP